MKTIAKKLTAYGNLGIVQFKQEPRSAIAFMPGAPEMKSGGLVISESTGEGVVGQLIAMNHTKNYLLLTDADILVGAKQNRVVNYSLLLAPYSKTTLDVSCIERLRWHYVSDKFDAPKTVAEHMLRKEKTKSLSLKFQPGSFQPHTQSVVWSHIHDNLEENKCFSETESYADLIDHRMKKIVNKIPACEPENECNGIAVVLNHKVISADVFGNEEVYRYYFPLMRDSAFRAAEFWNTETDLEEDEAFYRVLDFLDNVDRSTRKTVKDYKGSGIFQMVENNAVVGQELTLENQPVHTALFAK
jgi:hypothetical protein